MKNRLLKISCALGMLAVMLSARAQAQSLPDPYYLVDSDGNNVSHCLQVFGWGVGQYIGPQNCTAGPVPWQIEYVGRGPVYGMGGPQYLYRLRSRLTGQCIDLTNRSVPGPEGQVLATNICSTQHGIFWTIAYTTSDGAIVLVNENNGKCLTSYGWVGTALVAHSCTPSFGYFFGNGQLFSKFTVLPVGYFHF